MIDYSEINAKTWDMWAKNGCEWSVPISHEAYLAADERSFRVFLGLDSRAKIWYTVPNSGKWRR